MCSDKARCIFCLGICSLILGALTIAGQLLVFGLSWSKMCPLEISLTCLSLTTGVALMISGVVDLCHGYKIRQIALFERPSGSKPFRRIPLALIIVNGITFILSLAMGALAFVLAEHFYDPNNFFTHIDSMGMIHVSPDESMFNGSLGMIIAAVLSAMLTAMTTSLSALIQRYPRQTIAAVSGLPYDPQEDVEESTRSSAATLRYGGYPYAYGGGAGARTQ